MSLVTDQLVLKKALSKFGAFHSRDYTVQTIVEDVGVDRQVLSEAQNAPPLQVGALVQLLSMELGEERLDFMQLCQVFERVLAAYMGTVRQQRQCTFLTLVGAAANGYLQASARTGGGTARSETGLPIHDQLYQQGVVQKQ